MATVVGVHGINQQLKGPEKLRSEWWPSLKDGVTAAEGSIAEDALVCAFYGDLFRPPESQRAGGADPAYRPVDVQDGFETELLQLWWSEAAQAEPERVFAPGAAVRGGTPAVVQAGLRALSRSTFFAGMAERALIGSLKQVRSYMNDPAIRDAAQRSVDAVVTPDTRVILAHSLGSVVAFEALHRFAASANWANVSTFVTIGSPLGIRNLIFDALRPAPVEGKGKWPPRTRRWVNVSDDHDVVALQKKLGDFFGGDLVDMRIDNGATAHDVSPYLTSRATGAAIADGLQ